MRKYCGISFFALVASFILLVGCTLKPNHELKHCVGVPRDALTSFLPEDMTKLYNAFNIVIPVNETDLYVHSFSRQISDYVGEWHTISFTIEIGGVKDYDAFYTANAHRIADNGEKGKAMNEFLTNGSNFYLTYVELLYDDPQFLKENDNQAIYDNFNNLYESIAG